MIQLMVCCGICSSTLKGMNGPIRRSQDTAINKPFFLPYIDAAITIGIYMKCVYTLVVPPVIYTNTAITIDKIIKRAKTILLYLFFSQNFCFILISPPQLILYPYHFIIRLMQANNKYLHAS